MERKGERVGVKKRERDYEKRVIIHEKKGER